MPCVSPKRSGDTVKQPGLCAAQGRRRMALKPFGVRRTPDFEAICGTELPQISIRGIFSFGRIFASY
uniref:Uncharacterized protein n=1 Tax=mine drainage metagenome TaxID=410659 RepID=E6PVN4_9ZZZZ